MTTTFEKGFAEFWKGQDGNSVSRDIYDAADDWMRSSSLKDYWQCPFLYNARHNTAEMKQKEPTAEMFLGTCFHGLVLEDTKEYRVAGSCGAELASGKRKGELCGLDASEYYDKTNECWVCGKHKSGRDIEIVTDAISAADERRLQRMVDAVHRYPEVEALLDPKHREVACRSVCPHTCVKKKALIDILQLNPYAITDLKTVSPSHFNSEGIWRQFDQRGWGLSMAHYESVLNDILASMGKPLRYPAWQFILVESDYPHRCQIWPDGGVPAEVQAAMRKTHLELLGELANSQESGEWPERPLDPGVPQWFFYRHGFQREVSQ